MKSRAHQNLIYLLFTLLGILTHGCHSDSVSVLATTTHPNPTTSETPPTPPIVPAPAPTQGPVSLLKVEPSELPALNAEGDLEAFKDSLKKQIARCKAPEAHRDHKVYNFGGKSIDRQTWCLDTNNQFLALAETSKSFTDLMSAAHETFDWYRYEDGAQNPHSVLFTGYDAPTLEASLTPTPQMNVPLYRRPDDLVEVKINGQEVWRKLEPDGSLSLFPDRKAIDQGGVLKGQGLELAYVSDWFSAFILQVQGSGRLNIHTPNGVKSQFINFAAENGHAYVSVSHYLKEQGVPANELTVPGMRRYFDAHPDLLLPDLAINPSYVFFQLAENGPYGSEAVILTPHHSVAIDPSYYPMGAVTLFNTQRPSSVDSTGSDWTSFSTLAVTQDVGGAIQGPGRVDIFWGGDSYAETAAGLMAEQGGFFIALPKNTPKNIQ